MWNDRALSRPSGASDLAACFRPPLNRLNSRPGHSGISAPEPSSDHGGDANRTTTSEESRRAVDSLTPAALTTIRGLHHALFRRILLLHDSSPGAEKVLDLALDVARYFKAKLLILGVGPLPDRSHVCELHTVVEDARVRLSRKFYEIRLSAMNEGLWVETMLALGDAAELTLRNAERFRASLIIVGTQEVSRLSASGMRSVPDAVSRRAHCPVLVAR
jgi:nucleotide-binding universal stress UspA family protein